jgi:hypothetical protein
MFGQDCFSGSGERKLAVVGGLRGLEGGTLGVVVPDRGWGPERRVTVVRQRGVGDRVWKPADNGALRSEPTLAARPSASWWRGVAASGERSGMGV